MQVVLIMFRSDGEKRSFSIVRDVTVMGRREDCDFRIPLADISRKHCRMMKDGESLRIQDLGSSNGTFINGQRIQEQELSPGDTLNLGTVSFVVQIDGIPAEEEISSGPIAKAASGEESGEFDPLAALSDSNADSDVTPLTDSALNRDLLSELGDSGTRERD